MASISVSEDGMIIGIGSPESFSPGYATVFELSHCTLEKDSNQILPLGWILIIGWASSLFRCFLLHENCGTPVHLEVNLEAERAPSEIQISKIMMLFLLASLLLQI